MEEAESAIIQKSLPNLDLLWREDDPIASEVAFRELLPVAEQHPSPEPGYLVELLTRIGRAESAQGKLNEARLTFAKAEILLPNDPDSTRATSAKLNWMLEMGRLRILEKTPSQARPLFMEAWALASKGGQDRFAVEAALLMATIEPQKLQQEWVLRAIKLAEESAQPTAKRLLGGLYMALGWRLYDLRQFENALQNFQKALTQLKLNGEVREIFVAKWSIGKLYRTMGRLEDALMIQKTLLSELGIGGERDGRLYEELAECLHALKRAPEAQPYFELAYRELSGDEWIADNQPVKLKRLKDLGKVKNER